MIARPIAPLLALPAVPVLAGVAAGGCARVEARSDVVTIRCSYWGKVQESRIWQELARRFNAGNPRVQVKLEHITGWNYHFKVLAMTVGRCAPDVLSADDEQFRQLARNGLYEDLGPYIASDPDLKLSAFYKQFVDSFTINGKHFGIPYIGNCLLVFYNRDHRRAAGLPPDPDPNWDWEQFNRDAVALTRDRDKDGRTDQFGLARLSWFYCLQWIWGAGGTDMDPAMTRYTFDTPEARKGFQFHYDQMHRLKVTPLLTDLPNMNVEAQFLTGRVSMVINGPWWLVQARQARDLEWDVAHMPRGPVTRATRATAEALCISPQSRHKREAWEWIKFCISDEGQRIMARSGRGIPAIRRVADQTIPDPSTPQHEERFLEAMRYARLSSLHPHFMATEPILNREWDRVVAGKLTIDQFVKAALPQVNAIIQGDDL